jgi:hypothetical protein
MLNPCNIIICINFKIVLPYQNYDNTFKNVCQSQNPLSDQGYFLARLNLTNGDFLEVVEFFKVKEINVSGLT